MYESIKHVIFYDRSLLSTAHAAYLFWVLRTQHNCMYESVLFCKNKRLGVVHPTSFCDGTVFHYVDMAVDYTPFECTTNGRIPAGRPLTEEQVHDLTARYTFQSYDTFEAIRDIYCPDCALPEVLDIWFGDTTPAPHKEAIATGISIYNHVPDHVSFWWTLFTETRTKQKAQEVIEQEEQLQYQEAVRQWLDSNHYPYASFEESPEEIQMLALATVKAAAVPTTVEDDSITLLRDRVYQDGSAILESTDATERYLVNHTSFPMVFLIDDLHYECTLLNAPVFYTKQITLQVKEKFRTMSGNYAYCVYHQVSKDEYLVTFQLYCDAAVYHEHEAAHLAWLDDLSCNTAEPILSKGPHTDTTTDTVVLESTFFIPVARFNVFMKSNDITKLQNPNDILDGPMYGCYNGE